MGTQRTSFEKLQRDRAKKAKAAAKREKRLAGPEDTDVTVDDAPPVDSGGELSAAELLSQIEHLHKQFESKAIDFDTFEERKEELLGRLPID